MIKEFLNLSCQWQNRFSFKEIIMDTLSFIYNPNPVPYTVNLIPYYLRGLFL
jgi:hypothetical protein